MSPNKVLFSFQNSAVLSWSHGVIILYAVNDKNSFKKVEESIARVRKITMKNASIMVVANKVDLLKDRQVSLEEGQQLATKYDCGFAEISSKMEAHGVNLIYDNLSKDVMRKQGIRNRSPMSIKRLFSSLSEQAGRFLREHHIASNENLR